MSTFCYVGKGEMYMGKIDNPLRFVGNVSEFKVTVSENSVGQKDWTSTGGGEKCALSRIDSVGGSVSLLEYSPENLAMALYGNSTSSSDGGAQNDTGEVVFGSLIETTHLVDLNQPYTVVGAASYTEEAGDFKMTTGGVRPLKGGNMVADETVTITYVSPTNYGVIEPFTESSTPYKIKFTGLNEAQSGRGVIIEVYKTLVLPTSEVSFINDDFGSIVSNLKLLSDDTVVGTGLSKFMKITMEFPST